MDQTNRFLTVRGVPLVTNSRLMQQFADAAYNCCKGYVSGKFLSHIENSDNLVWSKSHILVSKPNEKGSLFNVVSELCVVRPNANAESFVSIDGCISAMESIELRKSDGLFARVYVSKRNGLWDMNLELGPAYEGQMDDDIGISYIGEPVMKERVKKEGKVVVKQRYFLDEKIFRDMIREYKINN